jgi:hypothetical protein
MNEFLNSISPREIAILIWGFIFFVVLLILSKNYKGLINIIKLLFSKILIYCYIFIGLYISLIYYLIKKTIFWDSFLIKDFIFWCVGFALVSLFNSNNINSNAKAFTKFKNIFSLTVFTDFFINFFTFELGWEMIFIPVVSLIGILKVYTDHYLEKDGYLQVNKVLKKMFSMIGVFIFIYCLYRLYFNYNEITNNKTIKSFLLPVILSVLYFPVMIFFACLHQYENLFQILNSSLYINKMRKIKIKIAIIFFGNFNIDKLNKIKNWDKFQLQNNSNIFNYISSL